MAAFVSGLSEAEVVSLLSLPAVGERLGGSIGADAQAIPLSDRKDTYKITGCNGSFIVRFPRDEAHLSVLRREERIQTGLRDRVTLLIPDTRVIDDLDGCPAFAVHSMVPGEPLTSDMYLRLSGAARDRLVSDLVNFFRQTHSISLEVACDWLGVPFDGEQTAARLASAQSKHIWFGPDAVAEMRPQIESLLDDHEKSLFEETVHL